MEKIYKRFYGETLAVDILEEKEEKLGDYSKDTTGLFLPKNDALKNKGCRRAVVIQVSEELKDMYNPGETIQIGYMGREKEYTIDGKRFWIIPKQDVVGVL